MLHDEAIMTTPPQQTQRNSGRLERPIEGRILGGVAAGLARRYDIGVGWVRAGFVVAFFFAGFGILAYILGWLLMPREDESEAVATRYLGKLEGASSWVGTALIGLAALIILGGTGAVRGELIWAGALILVGVLLYRGDLDKVSQPNAVLPPPPEPPVPSPTVPEEGERVTHDDERPPPPLSPIDLPPPPPPHEPRPASILGGLTIAVILIAVGVVWLLDRTDVISPDPAHYAAIVVGVAGLGLLVGTWFGRGRGLIAIGIITLPFLLFFSVVDVPWGAGWGERDFHPTIVSEGAIEYRLAGGEMLIDLSSLDFGDRSEIEVDGELGFGEMRVIVPHNVAVVADAEVAGGQILLLGSQTSGITIDRSISTNGSDKLLVLDLRVGFGELTVVRARN